VARGWSSKEANIDLTGTDGIIGKSTAQVITGLKSWESTAAAAGGVREVAQFGIDPVSGTAADGDGGRLTFYADDDGGAETDILRFDWVLTDASAATEESRLDISAVLAGTFGVIYSGGYSSAGVGSHNFTIRDTAAASVLNVFSINWDPDSGTALDNQGLSLRFLMADDADAQTIFGQIDVIATDVSDASEASSIVFRNQVGGTLTATATIDAGGIDLAAGKTFSVNGVDVGLAYANDGDNRIVTGDGSGGLNGEANLTFDGTVLAVTGGMTLSSTSTISGDMTFNDDVKLTLGTGGDADLYYDGTDVVLNPKVVGSGVFSVSGDIHANSSTATIEIGTPTTKTVSKPTLYLGTGGAERGGTLTNISSSETYLASNAYYNSGWKYVTTNVACFMGVAAGTMHFSTAASGTADTAVTFTERMTIDSIGYVGIGNAAPSTYIGEAIGLALGDTGDSSNALMLAASGSCRIGITNSANTTSQAGWNFTFATGKMDFYSTGSFHFWDTANDKSSQGVTIQQGAFDDEILAFKSSDVEHGVTDDTETDTYGYMRKYSADAGGVAIQGYSEGDVGIYHKSTATIETTTKATSADGNFVFQASLKTGTATTTHGTNANLFVLRNHGTTRFIFDADGDSHQDVGTAWTNFDAYEDVAITRALGMTLSPETIVQTKWDDWGKANKELVYEVGLMQRLTPEQEANGERSLVNMTTLAKVHNGAIGQLYASQKDLELMVIEELEQLKAQVNNLLMERN
jgi:hypothetical protein